MLRRFLRARTYDLEKATTMWLNHMAFKEQWQVDTILQDFYFVGGPPVFARFAPLT